MNSTVPAPTIAHGLRGGRAAAAHRARALRRRWRSTAPPRPPSDAGAATCIRARTARRCCRGCRRTPAPRCGAGWAIYFSISTWSSPKAACASRLAPASASASSPARCDDAHALAAAAGRGLDQHGIADALGLRAPAPRVLIGAVIARHDRHAGLLHQRLGRRFRSHRADGLRAAGRRRSARPSAQACREIRILGEKAIAGMDRLRAGSARAAAMMRGDVEIAVARRRRTDADALRRRAPHASASRSASENTAMVASPMRFAVRMIAAGDLAAIGDQELVEAPDSAPSHPEYAEAGRLGRRRVEPGGQARAPAPCGYRPDR